MKTAPLAAVLALLMTLSAATFAQTPASAERYVDLTSTLQTEADFNTWYEGVYRLRQDFDEICGDTFCEGDYSNIQALRFVCSARAASGEIGQCVWSFAASDERIKPRAGHVRVAIPGFRCVSPLAPHTTVSELLTVLASPHPLRALLPRTSTTLYDGLGDCL